MTKMPTAGGTAAAAQPPARWALWSTRQRAPGEIEPVGATEMRSLGSDGEDAATGDLSPPPATGDEPSPHAAAAAAACAEAVNLPGAAADAAADAAEVAEGAEGARLSTTVPIWRQLAEADAVWNGILANPPPQGCPAVRCLLIRDQRWTTHPETRLVLDRPVPGVVEGDSAYQGALAAADLHAYTSTDAASQRPALLTAVRHRWGGRTLSVRRGGIDGPQVAEICYADAARGEEGIGSMSMRATGAGIAPDDPEGELGAVVYTGDPRSRTRPRRTTFLVPATDRRGQRSGWAGGERSRSLEDAWRAAGGAAPPFGIHVMPNKEPRWDAVSGCWQLGFGGRAKEASARNLIIPAPLAQACDDPPTVLLGRMSRYVWSLDFAFPAGALQAFLVALGQFELPD
eukprot:TRINITY_DN19212_c0_g1_i1.p1 TRINITY_DN19212_c0_g1~~TRINITY_DN19212_c0_g1_i1.p1  ORF type:complete len:401 (+),score=76.73 TRINITY_DN19212_c0_g1_i1:145-1347(+)